MMSRHLFATVAIAAALFACSRKTAEPSTEAPSMTPASGPAAPATEVRPGCAENFQGFDENADGRVSEDEFKGAPHARPDPAAVFRERDRDGDGSLTESEFCSGFRAGSGMGSKGGMGRGPMHQRGAGGPKMGPHCEQHFDAFDANRDGSLTREEFAAWPHVHGDPDLIFGERDGDRNGTLTRSEFCSGWSGSPPR
jgi:Ca2+-binding EF-hand superfamily protein